LFEAGIRIQQELGPKLHMTAELRQSIELLQYSAQELASFLQEQAYSNPLIEVVWGYESLTPHLRHRGHGKKRILSGGNDDISLLELVSDEEKMTLERWVERQLRMMPYSREQYRAVMYLAGNMDESGYLTISAAQAAADLSVPEHVVLEALQTLQSLDPAGIGARNLQECLTLQIRRDPAAVPLAYEIVRECLPELAKRKYGDISRRFGVSLCDVEQAARYILTLDPKPGASIVSEEQPDFVIDAYVRVHHDRVEVTLNEGVMPSITVRHEYARLLQQAEGEECAAYVRKHLASAHRLMKSLEQRNATLLQVITAVVEKQRGFFSGDTAEIVPLTLKQVADRIGKHESTVSRTVKNKTIYTPRGLFELRRFFVNGVEKADGEMVSAASVRARIKAIIDAENKRSPWSDQQICAILTGEGVRISRRTVAKYREEMRILSAALRRERTGRA